jgi:hypothetical protein
LTDLWYLLEDCDRYVYHFTGPDTLVSKILPGKELRFSRFGGLDDPREYRDWVFSFSGVTDAHTGADFESIQEQLNRALKHDWRIGCFVRDPAEAVMAKRDEPGPRTLMRMYRRGHSLPGMWAKYAKDHAGACLAFDRDKLDRAVRSAAAKQGARVTAQPVRYEDPAVVTDLLKPRALLFPLDEARRIGLRAAIDQHIAQHGDELFFLKALDWQHQHEYRWTVQMGGDEELFVPFGESLVGIALGDRFPSASLHKIRRFSHDHTSVSIAQMRWQNGVPQPQLVLPNWMPKRPSIRRRILTRLRTIWPLP